ncbi:MAG: low specificity L-threonine aldolase [Chloroflexaceae bacterium]|nr:low specificity L-threonine aldolase [Chloroflexaceae bacterium]
MIDLSSDTATRPTAAMRNAMAQAQVGDEQRGEDPTINRLNQLVADMLGKEAALFLPSGTMCNVIAVKVHTQPGDALLADRQSHILRSETGGAALVSGVIVDQLPGHRGQFTAEDVLAALPTPSVYAPVPRLVCVEQTHNFGGGTIWPLEQLQAVCAVAHTHGLAVHMDGARLFNAVVTTGISARTYAEGCDSVWVDFSKGLGAPMGAVLAGSTAFIESARRYKHLLGGALRQAGVVAAGCIYALEHHIWRLQEDHEHARLLANHLITLDGIDVQQPVETNMVFFDTSGAGIAPSDFLHEIERRGVRMSQIGSRIRAVPHLDITPQDMEQAIAVVEDVITTWKR